MIWNVLQALTAFFILVKGIKYYKKIQKIFIKLKQSSIINVSQLHELLKSKKPLEKMFVVLKGKAKAQSKSGQNDILSIIKIKDVRQKTFIQNQLEQIQWQKILNKTQWKRPRDLKNMKFGLKDLATDQLVSIQNCQKSNIAGAISQIYSQKMQFPPTKNALLRCIKYIYNFLTSILPFRLFLNPTRIGQEIKYYGILDDQFLLAIGQVQKNVQGQLSMKCPYYLTKQKAFIQQRLKKKMNYLYWMILLIGALKVYALYQIAKKCITIDWKRRNNKTIDEQEQKRSDQQGDFANCIICYTNIRSIVLKPCKHYGFCNDCYNAFKSKGCPICKTNISGCIKIIKKKQ